MRFSIYRYDPDKDAHPRMQDYELSLDPADRMLLDALIRLKAQDDSLSFRRSCREGVCGSDGMNINGKNGLACITKIADLPDKVTLRPLPGLPVVRDLIVDMTQFFNQYHSVRPYLITHDAPPERERLQSPAEREALWWSAVEALAAIHRLDWRAIGFGFLEDPVETRSPIAVQLDQYRRYFEWAARGKRHPTCEDALAWLEANAPTGEPTRLEWGDARIGNMIFGSGGRCVAVLDWEMVTLGSPEADLAWFLFLDEHHSRGVGAPRLPGFPSREATLARYAELTGHTPRHLPYYEVFAAFRFSVIMMRLAQQFTTLGLLPADSDFETNNTPSRMLADMLGLPSPAEAMAALATAP